MEDSAHRIVLTSETLSHWATCVPRSGGVCCDCRLFCAFSGFDDRHRLRLPGHQHPVRIFTRTETCRGSGSCSDGVAMAVKLCPDRERVTLAIAAACVMLGSSIA